MLLYLTLRRGILSPIIPDNLQAMTTITTIDVGSSLAYPTTPLPPRPFEVEGPFANLAFTLVIVICPFWRSFYHMLLARFMWLFTRPP